MSWEKFWWSEISAWNLKWVRITFGTSVFFLYSVRFWNLDFYNENSLVQANRSLELYDLPMKPLWSWNFWPDSMAFVMNLVFLFLIFLLTIGKTRRPLMWVAWVIHVGFLHRNWSASMGVDTMVTVFLLYLSFCEVWKDQGYDLITRTMAKMAALHFCIIYFYTGVEKFRGVSWWEGSSLWIALTNPQMAIFDFTWISTLPWLLALMAHVTMLFELFFGVLVFSEKTRRWVLGVGVCFHLGIALSLDLWAFSAVMLSQYFWFLKKEDFRIILRQKPS